MNIEREQYENLKNRIASLEEDIEEANRQNFMEFKTGGLYRMSEWAKTFDWASNNARLEEMKKRLEELEKEVL